MGVLNSGPSVVIACAALSWIVTELVRRWSVRRQLFDMPGDRSSHTLPTPRGGGLGIVLAALIGVSYLTYLHSSALRGWAIAATLLAIVSAIDDYRSLRAGVRLALHFSAAAILVSFTGPFTSIWTPLHSIPLGHLALPLTLFWIVAVTNAYNFMDGIDGMAGGTAVIAGFAWWAIGTAFHEPVITVTGALISCAAFGFLVHNWPPARIFMGDVGSTFLGFTFATLPLFVPHLSSRMALPAVVVLWPFLFDTGLTILLRLKRGENILTSHRSHLYQRLVIAGYSHRKVTLLYMFFAVLGALAAAPAVPRVTLLVIGFGLASMALWIFVLRVEYLTRSAAQTSNTAEIDPTVLPVSLAAARAARERKRDEKRASGLD